MVPFIRVDERSRRARTMAGHTSLLSFYECRYLRNDVYTVSFLGVAHDAVEASVNRYIASLACSVKTELFGRNRTVWRFIFRVKNPA